MQVRPVSDLCVIRSDDLDPAVIVHLYVTGGNLAAQIVRIKIEGVAGIGVHDLEVRVQHDQTPQANASPAVGNVVFLLTSGVTGRSVSEPQGQALRVHGNTGQASV